MTPRGPRLPLRPALAWLGVLAVLVAMAASARHLWPMARANALAMQPLAQIRAWQAPRALLPDTEQWLQTRAALGRALALDPHSAELQEAMTYLYMSAALRPGQSPTLQLPYLNQALLHLDMAIAARPMVPSAWANRALALHRLALLSPALAPSHLPLLWQALDRALAYGAREPGVQHTLGAVVFERWSELGESRQQAVRQLHAQAMPVQRRALEALAQHHRVGWAPLPP